MRTEPPPDYICPDKFLIQSTFITADREKLSLTDIVRKSLTNESVDAH